MNKKDVFYEKTSFLCMSPNIKPNTWDTADLEINYYIR